MTDLFNLIKCYPSGAPGSQFSVSFMSTFETNLVMAYSSSGKGIFLTFTLMQAQLSLR